MHCEFPGIEQTRDADGVFCKEICLWIFPSKWNRNLFVRLTSSPLTWRTTLLFDTISISPTAAQNLSSHSSSFCLSMLFEELFRNISFLHRFLASEIHSCEEVGVLIIWMLLLELACVVVLPCWQCCGCRRVPWKSGGILEMQKVDQWRFIHTQVFSSATK